MEKQQIMQVKKFAKEIRELCLIKSNLISNHMVHGMSPKVILRRLTPKAIEQHTRLQRVSLRRQSLSEGEVSMTSSCTDSEDEDTLSMVQQKVKMQNFLNNKSEDIPPETRVVPTSVAQHIPGPDLDENDDVLNSDYSGELPNLNDPSWVSPSKGGNNTQSPKKRQWKKKKMRDEIIKKRGDGKLMMHARKAYEHQRKMFISSNIEKKKTMIGQALASRDDTVSPEPVQQGQQLPRSPTTPEPSSLSVFPSSSPTVASGIINHDFLSKLRANMCQSIPKNSMNDLTQPVFTHSQPQLISTPQHMAQEGVASTQDSPPAFRMTISNIHTLAALSPAASENESGMDNDDINMQEGGNSSYDSDQTVAFEASPSQCSNIQNNNLGTVKEGNWSRNADDGTGPKKRKRLRFENRDTEIMDNNKKVKPNPEVAKSLSYGAIHGLSGGSSTTETVPQERETPSSSRKTKSGEHVYEGSALVLAQKMSKMLPVVDDKENRFCASPSEAESNNKGSLEKHMEFFKEISKKMLELNGKKTKCEEKIKLIKEECDKKIGLLESEKKEYELEMEALTLKVHNWNDSAVEKETSHTAEQETDPLDVGQPTFVAVNSLTRPSQDVSSYKLAREIPVFSSAARVNIIEGAKSCRDQQKNRIINIIPAASITHFGSTTHSPTKKQTAKKSMAKPKAAAAAAAAAIASAAAVAAASPTTVTAPPAVTKTAPAGMILKPVSSNLPARHKVLDQTNRDSAHGTIAVVSSGAVLQPQNPPPTQVQANTKALWSTGMVAAQPVVSSVAPGAPGLVMANVLQPQLLGLRSIQPDQTLPTYEEHQHLQQKQKLQSQQQLIAADMKHKNRIAFVQKAAYGFGTVSAGNQAQLGQVVQTQANQPQVSVSIHQQQPNQALVQLQPQVTNPLLNNLLQQPQQNFQHLVLQQHQSKSLLHHRNNDRQVTPHSSLEGGVGHCIKLGAAVSKPTQGQQRDGQTLASTSGGPVSKPGHQSHLLVSAIPAPTSGAAMARFVNKSQSSPSVVPATSKPGHQPQVHIPYISTSSVMGVVTSHHHQPQQATTHKSASMEIPPETTVPPRSCFLCGVTGEFTCCNSIVYCSQTCQIKDWTRHQPECSQVNNS